MHHSEYLCLGIVLGGTSHDVHVKDLGHGHCSRQDKSGHPGISQEVKGLGHPGTFRSNIFCISIGQLGKSVAVLDIWFDKLKLTCVPDGMIVTCDCSKKAEWTTS